MRAFFASLVRLFLPALLLAVPLLAWYFYGGPSQAPAREIAQLAEHYVKAIYSRDFAAAYQKLSARDRDAKSQETYVSEQGSFNGFTLQLAAKLATFIEVAAARPIRINGERAVVAMNLNLPDVEKLAPLVLNWDEEKLNSMSATDQAALLLTIDARQQQAAIPFTHVQETLEFVRENNRWQLLLNWRSGVQVDVKMKLPAGAPLDVMPVNPAIRFQPGEPFTITLRLKNPTNKELRARVMHNVEPKSLERYLGVGDCGTFLPFRLAAGKEDENRSTFLVWTNLPAEIKRFTMIYEFEVDKQVP